MKEFLSLRFIQFDGYRWLAYWLPSCKKADQESEVGFDDSSHKVCALPKEIFAICLHSNLRWRSLNYLSSCTRISVPKVINVNVTEGWVVDGLKLLLENF